MTTHLTIRDLDLLDVLTRRVRLLTLSQIAELWWPDGKNQQCPRRRMEALARSELIEIHRVNTHPLLPVTTPLVMWKPGDERPNVEHVAERCRTRWNRAAVPVTVCVASPKTAHLIGSTAHGMPPQVHRDHDLRLASVYAAYRKYQPELASLWMGVHSLPKAGFRIKDPDASLRNADGTVIRVIESAGRNSASQIQKFHHHCEAHELPYELW
jgi:hypothetical protein